MFYFQVRRGLHGRLFEIVKLRTITVSATRGGGDPTRGVCALIRRFSVDELPQLWNVMRGDMALVGPRPHPIDLDDRFVGQLPALTQRYAVRPGITGLAQVCGARGAVCTRRDMRKRLRLDLTYIRRRCGRLDAWIMFRTLGGGFIAPRAADLGSDRLSVIRPASDEDLLQPVLLGVLAPDPVQQIVVPQDALVTRDRL